MFSWVCGPMDRSVGVLSWLRLKEGKSLLKHSIVGTINRQIQKKRIKPITPNIESHTHCWRTKRPFVFQVLFHLYGVHLKKIGPGRSCGALSILSGRGIRFLSANRRTTFKCGRAHLIRSICRRTVGWLVRRLVSPDNSIPTPERERGDRGRRTRRSSSAKRFNSFLSTLHDVPQWIRVLRMKSLLIRYTVFYSNTINTFSIITNSSSTSNSKC
jgi:hypothetical protein